jgi:solute carrier family 15 (oligopeptide transporter), member 1
MSMQADLTADTPAPVDGNPIARFFKSHPTGFWFFFWGEFAERCSFYGMRAILARYMADQLALGQDNAGTYVSIFVAACYFLPLLGGWVADRFFGKYWTIVGFSIPYILGHVILGIESFTFMAIALTLLAMGSGVIKPNISTLMGLTYDQQRAGQTKLRSDAFAIFYFAINIGAALSQFAMPPLRDAYGYAIAFLFPAVLMVIAFIIFAAGKKYYAKEEVREHKEVTPEEKAERWHILGRVAGLFFLVMFFWAIFDQASSTWIFFAEACMDIRLFGVEVAPDQIQAFNPVFILILLPPITLFIKYLDKRGFQIRATGKMLVGFLLTAGCMGVMALAAWLAGEAEKRPAILKGEQVKLVVSGDKMVAIDGKLRIDAPGDGPVSIQRETRTQDENGRTIIEKERWSLQGEGVLKLVPTGQDRKEGDPQALAVEGRLTKLVKSLKEDKKETLLEGTLQAQVEGKMDVDQRWFVAPDKKVTVWWQVFAYLIITVAEVLISVTGLELGYTAAPKSMTGFVTGIWLFTVGMGNLFINAPVTRLYTTMQPSVYFFMLTGLMLVVAVAFLFVARRFNRGAAAKEAAV